MRKIRIQVTPPDLKLLPENTEWIATSYLVSKSRDFDTPENILLRRLKDPNKEELIAELPIESKDTVYTRIMFHFRHKYTKLESSTKWSRTTQVSADQNGFKLSDIIIRTPVLTVNVDGSTVSLETQPLAMYSGGGVLDRSTWEVDDSDNYPIYVRKDDTTNITSLKTQSMGLQEGRAYVFKAKHITKTSNESTYGKKLYIDHNRGLVLFEFSLLNNFVKGMKLYWKVDVFAPKFKNLDLEIRDLTGKIILEKREYEDTTGFFITDTLVVGTIYEFYLRVRFQDDSVTPYKLVYSGSPAEIDLDWIYGPGDTPYHDKGHAEAADVIFGNIVGQDKLPGQLGTLTRNSAGVTSGYQLQDGSILFTEFVNNAISLFRFDGTNLFRLKRIYSPGENVDFAIDYLNVLPLPNSMIVLNYCTVDNKDKYKTSIWHSFEYDLYTRKLVELNRVEHTDEQFGTSMSTSAVMDNDSNIYYIPARLLDDKGNEKTLSIFKLNTKDMTREHILELPNKIMYNASFIRDIDGNMYIFNGSNQKRTMDSHNEALWLRDNSKVYKFNPKSKQLTELKTSYPKEWPDTIYCTQGYLKHDHKIVLFNAVHNGDSLGDQRVLIFDPKTQKFEVKDIKVKYSLPFRNSIVLKDGSILRISSREVDPQKAYIYIAADNYKIDETPNISTSTDKLVVPDGKLVDIEDAYRYESITIEGDGLLRWIGSTGIRLFTSKDLIITRKTTVDRDSFNKTKYDNIFILDGAELIVSGEEIPKQPVEKNLVVNSGDVTTIIDPYYYDSIKIFGSGRLIWENEEDGTVREFDSDWLFITRDTVMQQADFEKGGWSHTFVLDGVTFTIEAEEFLDFKTVKFFANGGTGEMASVDVPFGEWTIPQPTFKAPANKKFKTWAEDSVGKNPRKPGDKIEFGRRGIYNLYAIWISDQIIVPSKPSTPALDGLLKDPIKSGETIKYNFRTDPDTKLNVTIGSGEGTISVSNKQELTYTAPVVTKETVVTLDITSYVEYDDGTGAIHAVFSDTYTIEFTVQP